MGSTTIGQRLRAHRDLGKVLATAELTASPARTIHDVKGLEFPAVCVLLTTNTAKGILDMITGGIRSAKAEEDARKIYVAASRAERLLAFAAPRSQAERLTAHLARGGASVQIQSV